EVYIVQSDYFSGDNQWGGVGDIGGTTVHAAVANAIYTATGVRVRRLPLRNFDPATFFPVPKGVVMRTVQSLETLEV
ncbi:MAG: hypothetical protein V3S07_10765, partial [Micropepsaceae bacterium]